MEIDCVPKDIFDIYKSYLTQDEIIYYNNEWYKFPKDKLDYIIAKNGWIDLLQWELDNGHCWSEEMTNIVVLNGHLELLKFLIKKGYKFPKQISEYAVAGVHLDVLK